MRSPFSCAMALVALGACAGSQPAMTKEEFARLPLESRTAIYDAENDIIISLSRRDEAWERVRVLEEALGDMEDRWDKVKVFLDKRKQGKNGSMAEAAFDARRDYLGKKLAMAELAVKSSTLEVEIARARLDVVRQVQLARVGRAMKTDVKALEKRVEELEKDIKEQRKKSLDIDAETQQVFEKWKAAEEKYARSAGDYDAVVWVE